jgi:putative transposase
MPGRVVKRAYRYRCNRALEARTAAWYGEGRRVSYVESSALLTDWKRDPDLAFLSEVSSVPLQQSLRHLQAGFVAFWEKRARYPRFKSRKRGRQCAEYTSSTFRWRNGQLTLAKMTEPLNIRWSRPLPVEAEPSTVTVSRDPAGRWHLSLLVETTVPDGPATEAVVGVDAGITSLVTLSTGEKITNPRHERADRVRLARAQRRLARTARGSANRAKARRKVAKVYARITDRRRDVLHKLSTRLVRANQTVVIEDLQVRNMLGNHRLARAISDAGWRELRGMLEYKCRWYGRDLVVVDRWYPSSKVCSACGALRDTLPLGVREWACRCGATHDRDVNAAINIRAAGLAVLACGDGVRPARAPARVGSRR